MQNKSEATGLQDRAASPDAGAQGPATDGARAVRARGRPRAFDREAALDRATRLFWEKGYEATSISDLCKTMRIGSPSLYAAFGSKEALYAETLKHYSTSWSHLVWERFMSAPTARDAAAALLLDSAAALTGEAAEIPRGCMMTLSAVGNEGHEELGTLVRSGRAATVQRIHERIERAVVEGEVPASLDIRALARFVQTVQNGMSILARDGAGREELEAVAGIAMLGWDARVGTTD
ncbi:TetR/AcrR family transcriptional regulator [Aureimonas mangrovi]|uniref:TetR/AcrR family transcriptional regulator n=1 Tax=Aureimonas mangrovi TaxID=2758041 RepID=UPI00163DA525|nr:TetR/AcrR family transcriptional regulator [Aureimonas mangrovi]